MRTPEVRFPFIIAHRENRKLSHDFFSSFEKLDEVLKDLTSGTEEKFSLVLKKMVFLESALDELLEMKPEESSEKVPFPPVNEPHNMNNFFKGLIPILDSLDGAARLAAESGKSELNRGIELFDRKLLRFLASWEFVKSTDVGMEFDPRYHEAVGTDLSSSLDPGSIAEIIERGWIFRKKVLRFAKVIVVK